MFELRYPVFKRAEVNAHYTWTSAHFEGGRLAGKKIPFVAEHVWGFGFNYAITTAVQVKLEYESMGARYAIGDYENAYSRLPGFGLIHATLSYDAHPWRASLHAHNLTNVLYNEVAVLYYQKRFFYPSPERAFTAKIEYAWE